MSAELTEINTMRGKLAITQFWGGAAHSICLQLTQKDDKAKSIYDTPVLFN